MSVARKLDYIKARELDLATDPKNSDSACVAIAESMDPLNILTVAMASNFNHICQKKGHAFKEEVETAKVMIENPDAFFQYPIATILTPFDLSDVSERALLASECNFNSSEQKQDVLNELYVAMNSKGLAQTIIEDVMAVSDEMFTNAVFNAPFVDFKSQVNPGVNRKELNITLDEGRFGRIFLAHDEKRLVVGCQDPFGSLSLEKYLKKIHRSYEKGPAATMNFGPGGAGIGSYIIFNAGASLYFGVWPHQSTIICCVIPLGLTNRKRMGLAKHVHWIQR